MQEERADISVPEAPDAKAARAPWSAPKFARLRALNAENASVNFANTDGPGNYS